MNLRMVPAIPESVSRHRSVEYCTNQQDRVRRFLGYNLCKVLPGPVLQIRIRSKRPTRNEHTERALAVFLRRRRRAIHTWKLRRFFFSVREMCLKFPPTERTSETENQPPPPLWPLRATIAPGKNPTRLLPWILSGVLNLSGTRTPDPIIRDDSSVIEASLIFEGPDVASISAFATILPTTTTSSWDMVIKSQECTISGRRGSTSVAEAGSQSSWML